MTALDTNVVVRLIIDDDPEQVRLARAVVGTSVMLGIGILMETAWVLRSNYRQPRAAIAATLAALLDLPTVSVRDEAGIRWAIERYRDHGADLADMLHIVEVRGASSFASFEQHLGKQAGPASPVAVEQVC